MTRTAVEVDPPLIAFVVPSIPESVRIARLHVLTALGYHGLSDYAEDAEIITSELVTNAVQHVHGDGTEQGEIDAGEVRGDQDAVCR